MGEMWKQETPQERRERIARQRAADRASVRLHRPKVLGVEADGEYMSVEWTTEAGERVSGDFKLFGWRQPTRAAAEAFMKAHSTPPVGLYGGTRPPK